MKSRRPSGVRTRFALCLELYLRMALNFKGSLKGSLNGSLKKFPSRVPYRVLWGAEDLVAGVIIKVTMLKNVLNPKP